jgi:hypothetical protein
MYTVATQCIQPGSQQARMVGIGISLDHSWLAHSLITSPNLYYTVCWQQSNGLQPSEKGWAGGTKPFEMASLLCVSEEIFAQGRVGSPLDLFMQCV